MITIRPVRKKRLVTILLRAWKLEQEGVPITRRNITERLRERATTTSDVLITAVQWGFLEKSGNVYKSTQNLKDLYEEDDTNKVLLKRILHAETPHTVFLNMLMKSVKEDSAFSKGEFLAEAETNEVAFDVCKNLFCDDMGVATCSDSEVNISEYGRSVLVQLRLELFWERVKYHYMKIRRIKGDRNVLLEDVFSELAKEDRISEDDFLEAMRKSIDLPRGVILTSDPGYKRFGGIKYIAIE